MNKGETPDLAGLAQPPGPDVAALLDRLELAAVPPAQLVEVLRASWREVSHAYAGYLAVMAEIGRCAPADAGGRGAQWEWADSEIAAALTFTARRAQAELELARQLCGRLVRVWQALGEGQIDIHKARVFADYLAELTDQQITRILDRLLGQAPRLTPGQLAARLLREVQAVDQDYTRRRYERAVRDRGVWGYLAADGTAVLSAHGLSPAEAAAAAERLERLAEMVRDAGHPGTLHQLRADLFVRLLDGRFTGYDQPQIVAAMLAEVQGDTAAAETARGPAGGTGTYAGAETSPDTEAGTAAGATAGDGCGARCTDATPGLPGRAAAAGTGRVVGSGSGDDPAEGDPAEPATTPDDPASATGPVETETSETSDTLRNTTEQTTTEQSGDAEESGNEQAGTEQVGAADRVDDAGGADPASGSDPGPRPRGAPSSPLARTSPTPGVAAYLPSATDTAGATATPPTPAPAHAPGSASASAPGSAPSVPMATVPAEGARYGIEVRVGLATLLGLDEHPAEIPGWGPIPAPDARLLVQRQDAAQWRYALTDQRGYLRHGGLTRRRPPHPTDHPPCLGGIVEIHIPTGLLTELARCPDLPHEWAGVIDDLHDQYIRSLHSTLGLDDHPRARHPGAGLRRHIQLRDRTCIAPGCRRPARACHLDHTVDHQHGGPTIRANLEPLCERHHAMKHHGGWQLEQPRPGIFRWRSPLGCVYWTRGEPIAPDLPEPLRRPPDSHPDTRPDTRADLPIFTPPPTVPRRPPPPRPTRQPPDEPPF